MHQHPFGIHTAVAGRYDLWLRPAAEGARPDRLGHYLGHAENLVTDAGLDAVAERSWPECLTCLVLGKGTTPAAYADVGLGNYYARSTLKTSGGGHGIAASTTGHYIEDYTTGYWVNSTGFTQSITELGMTWSDTENPPLFSHVVLVSAVDVPDGFQLIVKYTLRRTIPQMAATSAATINIDGVDHSALVGLLAGSDGTVLIATAYQGGYFDASGVVQFAVSYALLDVSRVPSNAPLQVTSSSSAFAGLDTSDTYISYTTSGTLSAIPSLSTYTPGSYSRYKYITLAAPQMPSTTIYAFWLGSAYFRFICKIPAGVVKAADKTWTIKVNFTWGRAA